MKTASKLTQNRLPRGERPCDPAALLLCGVPAVNHQFATSDEIRLVGCEVKHAIGDVVGLAQVPDWVQSYKIVLHSCCVTPCRHSRLHHWCVDVARVNRVDADLVARAGAVERG